MQIPVDLLAEFTGIARSFWDPPGIMRDHAAEALLRRGISADVVVGGETRGVSFYVIGVDSVEVHAPFQDVRENPIVREFHPEGSASTYARGHCVTLAATPSLLRRLRFPKLLLVNLSVVENFPVPRLSLGIASIAAYVRRQQTGEVHLVDMQMGHSVEAVARRARELSPHLVGVSVSYGQKGVCFELLDALRECFPAGARPLFVAGNVIPASAPDEFLDRYPDLVMAAGEGERTLDDLARHLAGSLRLDEVEGLIRRAADGQIVRTPLRPLSMEDVPLPALDTVPELTSRRGAMTLELSRGCQYNVCTFCPRHHKSSSWKGMGADQALDQLARIAEVIGRSDLPRHVFLADEEFVGNLPDDGARKRVMAIADGIRARRLDLRLDTEARVDQVYDPRRDGHWHIRRIEMWRRLADAGLDRLFMGVESGATAQLKRYGKGQAPEQIVVAIRILSALGIGLRFGFVMFDPLMQGLADLKANIEFLERTDAILRPVARRDYDDEALFRSILADDDFVREHSTGQPIHSAVSYMLANLEVLVNSPYERMMELAERRTGDTLFTDGRFVDTNMARRGVRYLDPLVGALADGAQRWIDRNFALSYTVKSFYKTAPAGERHLLMEVMRELREVSHILLKTMVYVVDGEAGSSEGAALRSWYGERGFAEVTGIRRECLSNGGAAATLARCLELMETRVLSIIEEIGRNLDRGMLQDNSEGRLRAVLDDWAARAGRFDLINDLVLAP